MSKSAICSVDLEPKTATAGQRGTWKLTFTIGESGVRIGGAIRIRPPFKGMVRWDVGKVTARVTRPGVACEVSLFECHPITYHLRHTPLIQVNVFGHELQSGDQIIVTIGEPGGYSRGYFVRARAQKHAHDDAEWRFCIDTEGNKSLQREREIDDPWIELEPITMDVRSDEPDRLHVVARQPAPDQNIATVRLTARDRHNNFCDTLDGHAELVDRDSTRSIPLSDGRGRFEVEAPPEDVIRPAAIEPITEAAGTGNPICAGLTDEYAVYFGDLHVMSGQGNQSSLKGTEYALRWGRDISCLDFCTITNFTNRWDEDTALDDQFNEPGEFVTIPGYEKGFAAGHKNVYFPTTDVPAAEGSNPEELFEALAGREALAIPHHTSVYSEASHRTGWGEHDFDTHNPEFERLIEMTQNRGSMEFEEVGGNIYFGNTGSSVWSALQRGMKVGFVGGTDTHRAQPGEPNSSLGGLNPEEVTVGGLTAVLAEELTREAVWDALYSRRCYATQGQRTLLFFEMREYPMGSIIDADLADPISQSRAFGARIVAHRPITAIELVRSDGDITDLCEEGILTPSMDLIQGYWVDTDPLDEIAPTGNAAFYYLRVTEADGRMAWSSPIWIAVS